MMKQNTRYSMERFNALRTPAKVSDYFHSIDQFQPDQRVVDYGRVSSRQQKKNLSHQLAKLKVDVEKRGHLSVATVGEIAPGWEYWRTGFGRAIAIAKEFNAIVVARSIKRFWKSWDPEWKTRQKGLPLSVFDMKQLMAEADGVLLATVIPPDAPPKKEKSEETKEGQAATGNKGGHPVELFPKKAARLKNMPRVLALRKAGKGYGEIGDMLGIPRSTIRDWIKSWEKSAHLSDVG